PGAVNRSVLERLRLHSLGVNVSRGSLLDEAALLELLELRRLRGAALDVFATEPLPPEHLFWRHARVLVSPHVSAVTRGFWERETALIVDRKSTRLNSSHVSISYAVFCLKKKNAVIHSYSLPFVIDIVQRATLLISCFFQSL